MVISLLPFFPSNLNTYRLYATPEVLRAKLYTYSVDYWSLGCILLEILAGFPPFSGSTPKETWTNLKNWTKVLRRPEYDKPEDLIFTLTDIAWDAITRCISLLYLV
jgi:serine/threonine protein kinase